MARTKGGPRAHARHKKILKLAKGYRNRNGSCYRIARQRAEKGLQYAYRDRRNKKREIRSLWIMRINAACRQNGLTYSKFMGAFLKLNLGFDRKVLADMAMNDEPAFKAIFDKVVASMPKQESKKKAA
jgi:large subunit ribosomal protein L20